MSREHSVESGPRRGRSREGRSRSRSRSRSNHTERIPIQDDDASFILGSGGRTKRKLSRVCGAQLNITNEETGTILEIRGSAEARERAVLYTRYVMQQRVGPVHLDHAPGERTDLTVIEVPHECVGYVTGRKGAGLRSIEDEWKTLMFFCDLRSEKAGETERLAIFGTTERDRKGAELKVMSAVEQKHADYFTKDMADREDEDEGFAVDMKLIDKDDYSYVLGKEGSTRKKLARASGAILEYVGRYACIGGTRIQRQRARQYLQWLCEQRTNSVRVSTEGRDDVLVVQVPADCVAYVTGTKGKSLRKIEDHSDTFIFLDGTRGNESERLLIFGEKAGGREKARRLVLERIDEKQSGRSTYDRYDRRDGGSYGGRYDRDSPDRYRYRRRSRSRSREFVRYDRDRGYDRRRRDYSPSPRYERRSPRRYGPPPRRHSRSPRRYERHDSPRRSFRRRPSENADTDMHDV